MGANGRSYPRPPVPAPTPTSSDDTRAVLLTVSGPDRPGVTSSLMTWLLNSGAELGDVEQVVLRRHLALGVVASLPPGADLAGLRGMIEAMGLHLDVEEIPTAHSDHALGTIVTLLGRRIGPAQFGAVATAVAEAGGNIERIARLSQFPVVSYELAVGGVDVESLRSPLRAVALREEIDVAVDADGLGRRSRRLVVLDVDSTLIRDEIIELLADEAGKGEEVASITRRAMEGELDFEASLRARVALLEGLDHAAMERARTRVRFTPGARTFVRTLHRLGFRVALVSGGFTFFTDRLAEDLGIDHAFANVLEVADGRLTGGLVGAVVDRARKAQLLREVAAEEGIALEQVVAVGDGANDLDMLAAAGLGIAFNAKPVVREVAEVSLSVPYLDAVLFLLGVRRSEIEAADHSLIDDPPLD